LIALPSAVAVWASKYGVNALSAAGSALYVAYKRSRENPPAPWASVHTGYQFFNGFAVVPLLLLFGASFSDTAAKLVLDTNAVILAAAAAVALGALLADRDP
jgi:hypothetical protein